MIELNKQIGKVDSGLLASYILYKIGPISHLKLHKLLYYVQAFHLAYFDDVIIDDEFEAWVHGPVIRNLFYTLRDIEARLYDLVDYNGKVGDPTPEGQLQDKIIPDQIELIDDILDEYGKLSSLQLETLTHSELPWQSARVGLDISESCSKIISRDLMRDFYNKQIYGEEKTQTQ